MIDLLQSAAEKECSETWHHLQHMIHKEAALVAADKGKGAVTEGGEGGEGGAAPEQAAGGVQQEDLNSCPIW